MATLCAVNGCGQAVTKEGFLLCFPHWKAEKNGEVRKCRACGKLYVMKTDVCDGCAEAVLDEEALGKAGVGGGWRAVIRHQDWGAFSGAGEAGQSVVGGVGVD